MFGNNDKKFFALLIAAGYRFFPIIQGRPSAFGNLVLLVLSV